MAFHHTKEVAFTITDNGATERDLTDNITSVDFSREADAPETTVFGNSDRTYIAGLIGSNFSISGFFDDAANKADVTLNGLLGFATASTFEFGPEGSTTGDIRYTGTCFMTSYNVTGSVDGVVEFSADFIVTGAVTRNTFT